MPAGLYEIALLFLKDIGPVTVRNLVSYCGGVEAVFKEKKQYLLKIPGIGQHRSSIMDRDEALKIAEKEIELIQKNKLKTLFYLDDDFPHRLKAHADSPILLIYRGEAILNADRMLAIVGTRTPTAYGRMKCEQIIRELSSSGVTVVSGMAYGIDAAAHKASLDVGLPTIGVLGNGLPEVYPQDQHALSKNMLAKNGALISQFPCHAKPDRENFPMRNKTVAYMTDATLVIESRASGGSMITANFAFHNHRDLFALPGRSIDQTSEGCNKLIKANMAQLVTEGNDILKSMNWEKPLKSAVQSKMLIDLGEDESKIIELIKKTPEIHIDQLTAHMQLSNSHLAAVLLQLELSGIIKQAAGKRYILAN